MAAGQHHSDVDLEGNDHPPTLRWPVCHGTPEKMELRRITPAELHLSSHLLYCCCSAVAMASSSRTCRRLPALKTLARGRWLALGKVQTDDRHVAPLAARAFGEFFLGRGEWFQISYHTPYSSLTLLL